MLSNRVKFLLLFFVEWSIGLQVVEVCCFVLTGLSSPFYIDHCFRVQQWSSSLCCFGFARADIVVSLFLGEQFSTCLVQGRAIDALGLGAPRF